MGNGDLAAQGASSSPQEKAPVRQPSTRNRPEVLVINLNNSCHFSL
jgi:hypothetical protein